MTQDQIQDILFKHQKWLANENDGTQAYLHGADLRGADLREADLCGAYLCGADLHGADLCGAKLRGAYLRGADLCGAYLRGADLCGAYLRGADLRGADLRGAINIPFLPQTIVAPEEGSFIGWKKVNCEWLVKLEICENAKRSSATTRKCRCEFAKVISINKIIDGKVSDETAKSIMNHNYGNLVYTVGKIVMPDSFDEDRWNECSHGIHFFITKQEAIDY